VVRNTCQTRFRGLNYRGNVFDVTYAKHYVQISLRSGTAIYATFKDTGKTFKIEPGQALDSGISAFTISDTN
jgi:hypothetical protein